MHARGGATFGWPLVVEGYTSVQKLVEAVKIIVHIIGKSCW